MEPCSLDKQHISSPTPESELQSIQDFVLTKYQGTRRIYSTRSGFLLGLPRDLERLQAKLLSKTVQCKANTFKLITESFEDPTVSSRPLAKFTIQTLDSAANSDLSFREAIINYCILKYAPIATIIVFLCIFFVANLDETLFQATLPVQVLSILTGFLVINTFAEYLTSDHIIARLGTLVESVQQKQQERLFETAQSVKSLEDTITRYRKELTSLEDEIKTRREEASTIHNKEELYATIYILLQTAMVTTGENQKNVCTLICQALKKAEENPHVTGVAFGERKMDDVLSAARSTFTPKITEIKLRNQVAAAVRQNINDLISSTKITK